MTEKKLNEVLDIYEEFLEGIKYNDQLLHLKTMIPKMRDFILEGRREKTMRWLGFIQGVLWTGGHFDLVTLKQHNMPDGS